MTGGCCAPGPGARVGAGEGGAGGRGRSDHGPQARATGFWDATTLDVGRPYGRHYFRDVPKRSGRVGEDALAQVAALAYPSRVVEFSTAEQSAVALQHSDLTPSVRRVIVDADSQLREALASRIAFGVTGTAYQQ